MQRASLTEKATVGVTRDAGQMLSLRLACETPK